MSPPPLTQPRPFSFSLRDLLTLPNRLCNPPPAAGKVRSCGVTPVFEVRLEDVLNRKHLPPLGLKDFEEWLLYVEHCPENLYFLLWLREYTQRYNEWIAQCKAQIQLSSNLHALDSHILGTNSSYLHPPHQLHHQQHRHQVSPALAMFHARAKQTFFTPNSEYELNVPSDILAPFHASGRLPHPDPVVFEEVAAEVHDMLKESLQRFVVANYTNVGNKRAICGIFMGTLFTLLGSVAPIVVSILRGHSRWLRLTALPGMWLGLTVLIASLNGLCLSVYFFGDLRQLRKFELARPPISQPEQQKQEPPKPLPTSPLPHTADATSTRRHSHVTNAAGDGDDDDDAYSCCCSSSTCSCSSSVYSDDQDHIYISPEYYDDDEVEGPATSPVSFSQIPSPGSYNAFPYQRHQPHKSSTSSRGDSASSRTRHSFRGTATFIHPFSTMYDVDEDGEDVLLDDIEAGTRRRYRPTPEECQAIDSFDFDALPMPVDEDADPPLGIQKSPIPIPVSSLPRPPLEARLRPQVAADKSALYRHTSHVDPNKLSQPTSLSPESNDTWDFSPLGLIRRIQAGCTKKWRLVLHPHPPLVTNNTTTSPPPLPRLTEKKRTQLVSSNLSIMLDAPAYTRKQFKLARAVPAFASPLTRVLSPVIRRAQWEIVVRSTVMALMLSWMILGSLLAVPVRGH